MIPKRPGAWVLSAFVFLDTTGSRTERRRLLYPRFEVTRRVRQQTDETPVDDAMTFFELGPKRQTRAPRRSRNS